MKIRVYYTVWDGGDGSASPTFHKSREEMKAYIAKEEAEEEFENYDLSEGGSYIDIEVSDFEVISE